MLVGGGAIFDIDGQKYSAESGEILMIPGRMLHCCEKLFVGTKHSAFQINHDAKQFSSHKLPDELLYEFFTKISKCLSSENYVEISAYIPLLASYFDSVSRLEAERITDYGFLIHEFFSHHYGEDIHIEDLAAELHLSNRQAERLVIEHTGHTFGKELTSTRLSMAKHLMKTTEMSLTEIAEYVGYRTYAGFFKAMKKLQ